MIFLFKSLSLLTFITHSLSSYAILGGTLTKDFDPVVFLKNSISENHEYNEFETCSAVAIAPHAVLTALHCVYHLCPNVFIKDISEQKRISLFANTFIEGHPNSKIKKVECTNNGIYRNVNDLAMIIFQKNSIDLEHYKINLQPQTVGEKITFVGYGAYDVTVKKENEILKINGILDGKKRFGISKIGPELSLDEVVKISGRWPVWHKFLGMNSISAYAKLYSKGFTQLPFAGDSGGAVLNENFELIGIINSSFSVYKFRNNMFQLLELNGASFIPLNNMENLLFIKKSLYENGLIQFQEDFFKLD
jgi:V8-like Glu-specific endopeptidase